MILELLRVVSRLDISAFKYFFFGGEERFTPCKAEQPLQGMELQEKKAQKDYSTQEICLKITYKMSVNSRLKPLRS